MRNASKKIPKPAAAYLAALLLIVGSTNAAQRSTVEQAKAALAKATAYLRSISTEGGYLWEYSLDLQQRRGEETATASQIWFQPPGTPTVGMAFLKAYDATGDRQFLEAAGAAAMACARSQLESGGWDYKMDFDPEKMRAWYLRTDKGKLADAQAAKRRNISTFDDDNTQSAIRFLIAFVDRTKQETSPEVAEIRQALDYGLAKMLEAQYPIGAWPQRYDGKPRDPKDFPVKPASIPKEYPREWPKGNYYTHYTLNDNTQRDCIRTMLEAYHTLGRKDCYDAAKKGGDFLILAQLPPPQSAWAQQYNANNEPAWARAFEPPAVCGGESVGVMRMLIDLYLETGEEKYLKPIPAALDWFDRSQIAPNRWARFYELGTNKPIYGDRDGKIHYTLEEISAERASGYGWEGNYGVESIKKLYEQVRKEGREAYLAAQKKKDAVSDSRLRSLESSAKSVIASQDEQGRWIQSNRIRMRDFVKNMEILSDYLAAAGKKAAGQ